MTVRLVATVIAYCILPSSVLGVDYPFNIFLSPNQFQCQGGDVQLIYRYAYNNTLGPQRENQIIWTFGGISVLIVRRVGTDLVIESSTNPRIQWAGPSDPGTITITDVQASDAGDYQCQVFFFSGDNVKGTVNVDASNLLPTCLITPASTQCGNSTAPTTIIAIAPTYSAGCNPQINWLDNSTGSMKNLNTTLHLQGVTVTTGSCPGGLCSSLYVPPCHSASTVAYQAQWKVGSQVDSTSQPLCPVTQSLCPTTTAPTTIVPTTIPTTTDTGNSTTTDKGTSGGSTTTPIPGMGATY